MAGSEPPVGHTRGLGRARDGCGGRARGCKESSSWMYSDENDGEGEGDG